MYSSPIFTALKNKGLTRISHKILKKPDEMLCEMYRECDHYQIDKVRAIGDEDRMTGRSNFSRFCDNCGLTLKKVNNGRRIY